MTITHFAKLGDYHQRTESPKPRFLPTNLWGYPQRFCPTPLEAQKVMSAKATRKHLMRDDDTRDGLLFLEQQENKKEREVRKLQAKLDQLKAEFGE